MFTTFWFSREATASHFFTLKLMKKYTVKLILQEDGSSILPLPDEIVNVFNIKVGDSIELISSKEGELILKPSKKKSKLDDLIDGITKDNKHDEIDFGKKEGKEEW